MAFLSKELATINLEVPVTLDYEHLKFSDVNKEKIYELFKWLEFTKFLTKYDFSEVDTASLEIKMCGALNNKESNNSFEYNIDNVCIIDSSNISSYLNLFDTLSDNKEFKNKVNKLVGKLGNEYVEILGENEDYWSELLW